MKEHKELKEKIKYLIDINAEDETTEFKAMFKFDTKKDRAEFIRDMLSLSNVLNPDPKTYSYLIIGAKNANYLLDKGSTNIEESDTRSFLNSYIFPNLKYNFYKLTFDEIEKEILVFQIEHVNKIHYVNKEFKDNDKSLLTPGNSWTRVGSKKIVLTPEMASKYNEFIAKQENVSRFKIFFYYDKKYLEEITNCKLVLRDSEGVAKIKQELVSLAGDIDKIHLPTNRTPITKYDSGIMNAMGLMLEDMFKKVVFEEEEIKRLSQKHLGLEIKSSFFWVGDLVENPVHFIGQGIQLKGADSEKNKYKKILDYEKKIRQLDGLSEIFSALEQYHVLNLVLSNFGSQYDEDITVKLKIPNCVTVIEPDTFPIPNKQCIKLFLGSNGLLRKLFKYEGDHQVQPSPYNGLHIPKYRMHQINGPSYEDLRDDYYSELCSLYDLVIYNEEYSQILELNFKYLKHNENIAFDSIILVRTDKSFDIEYEINSKYNPKIERGSLKYLVPDFTNNKSQDTILIAPDS